MHSLSVPRFNPKGIVATAEQQAIQLSTHRISLIEANAGAAKTTTLALRIGEALMRGAAPQQILGLVFTEEALVVLQQRLVELGVAPFLVRQLALYTVEDFARQTLAFWEESTPPALTTIYELKPVVLEALERLSQRLQQQGRADEFDFPTHHVALSQFYQSQLRLKAMLQLQVEEDEDLQEKAWLAGVTYSDLLWTLTYEQLRQSPYEGVLFRGPFDGTYDLACALQQSPELLQLLPHYRLIVVDELHDANEAAFQVLRALLSRERTYLVAAGDRDQVIYKQLAADATYLHERFAMCFDRIQAYPLSHTYRHGPYLAYAVAAFKQKKVDSALPLGTQIHVHHYEPDQAVAPLIAAVQHWQQQGGSLAQCAVLLRDEHQSIVLENQLLTAQIPYQLHGLTAYLQRDEILFLRGLMALALNDLAAISSQSVRQQVVRAMALFSEVAMPENTLWAAAEEIAELPQLLRTFYTGQIIRTASEQGLWRTQEALGYLEGVASHTLAHEVLAAICEVVDIVSVAKRIYVFDHQADVIQKSIAAFIEVAKTRQLTVQQFHQWCAQHEPNEPNELSSPSNQKNHQAVVVSCVAHSKGKEYEHVLLPFLAQGEFPSAKNSGQIEQNLFYVAITRAQKRLSLFVPSADYLRSDYLKALQLEQVYAPAQQRLAYLRQQQQQAATSSNSNSNPDQMQRVDLQVPFAQKDEAKALGARWDPAQRVWYVPEGVSPTPFKAWWRAAK